MSTCPDCGEVSPADIHTCSPQANRLDATVFVYRHKVTGNILALYLEDSLMHSKRDDLEHLDTLEPRAWIEAHYSKVSGAAALEQPEQCAGGDRPKDQCPGEWEPGCDLGNNPKYARRVTLEQPEQAEPVAWIQSNHLQQAQREPFLCRVEPTQRLPDFVPLYAHPPRREWRGLTEEEIKNLPLYNNPSSEAVEYARAIEAALKEKNHE